MNIMLAVDIYVYLNTNRNVSHFLLQSMIIILSQNTAHNIRRVNINNLQLYICYYYVQNSTVYQHTRHVSGLI